MRKYSVARRTAESRGFDHRVYLHNRTSAEVEMRSAATATTHQPDAFRSFAREVAHATTGPVLRYSHRLQLLELAKRGGIDRFDANLIIAAIEHRTVKRRP